MSVWLEVPQVNAVPYRVFVSKGQKGVVAAIVFADDGSFYLAYSKDISGVVKDVILSSPYVNKSKKRYLVFRIGKRLVKTKGYLLAVGSRYSLDLLTEEVRYVIAAALDRPIKVRKLKSEEELPATMKSMTDEEKKIFELAPIDIPSEIMEIAGEELVVGEEPRKDGQPQE